MINIPFFSVGIPAYKASYLKECIDSILGQTFCDFELIIVNDASPENIDDIIKQYNDNRIIYHTNDKNIGAEHVVDNWNKCLQFATGKYFILMGDDDTMDIEYLSVFHALINQYPNLNIYHCRSYIVNKYSEKVSLTQSWPEFESVYENIWARINFYRNQYISDFVYNKEFLLQNGGFFKLPLAWASDDITSYIAMKDKGIVNTNKPIFNYRKSSITISSSGSPDLKMKAILEEEEWFKKFLQDIPENEIDYVLFQNIVQRLPKYILTKKHHIILTYLQRKGLFGIFRWLSKCKKYKINKTLLCYSMIEYIRLNFFSRKKL